MFKILAISTFILMVGCTIRTHHAFEKLFKKNHQEIQSDFEEKVDEYSEENIHFGPEPEPQKKSWWDW